MKRYHNLSLLSITLAIGFVPGVLRAAERDATDESPARQIKFVLEDKPLEFEAPVELRNAMGVIMLPKGTFYAAVVRGYAPLLVDTDRQGQSTASGFQAVGMLTVNHSTPAAKRLGGLMKKHSGPDWQFRFRSRVAEEATAASDAPRLKHAVFNNKLFDFLAGSNVANPGNDVDMQLDRFNLAKQGTRTPLQEYDFVAGTIENAKQVAQDFLAVHDEIFVRRLVEATKQAKMELSAARDKLAPKLDEANEQYAAAERELKGVEPLAEAAVNDLKVKRTLLKVELAGIKARVKTISGKLLELSEEERLEQGKPLPTRRRDQLVDLKVTADIDLASLAAQQDVLDDLIDGQRRLVDLNASRGKRDQLQNRMEHIDRNLPICDALLADLIPFQLVNDTIVIRPVKFVAKVDEAAGQ